MSLYWSIPVQHLSTMYTTATMVWLWQWISWVAMQIFNENSIVRFHLCGCYPFTNKVEHKTQSTRTHPYSSLKVAAKAILNGWSRSPCHLLSVQLDRDFQVSGIKWITRISHESYLVVLCIKMNIFVTQFDKESWECNMLLLPPLLESEWLSSFHLY